MINHIVLHPSFILISGTFINFNQELSFIYPSFILYRFFFLISTDFAIIINAIIINVQLSQFYPHKYELSVLINQELQKYPKYKESC